MKGPGIPDGPRHPAGPDPYRPWPGPGGLGHRLAAHAPAVALPVAALAHGTAVPVAAVLAAAHILLTAAGAVVRHWFWWRARSQPARDLRRLLRNAGSAQDAERLAQGLAARHQAVLDAYVRARPPRRAAPAPLYSP
ncbi:hypothetical protein [Streptomyces sp. NPDC021224]|uniref:hypothetical protein n=1 Tax=unclassified Streptomyces TaxID=2593676 RepID=UPI0037B93AD4